MIYLFYVPHGFATESSKSNPYTIEWCVLFYVVYHLVDQKVFGIPIDNALVGRETKFRSQDIRAWNLLASDKEEVSHLCSKIFSHQWSSTRLQLEYSWTNHKMFSSNQCIFCKNQIVFCHKCILLHTVLYINSPFNILNIYFNKQLLCCESLKLHFLCR